MKKKDVYKSSAHARYLCQYHLIWTPKFRYNVLTHGVDEELKQIFQEIAYNYEFEIIAMEIMPDHVHLFVGAKPDISPSDIVRIFKSISAIEVFKRFPKLRDFYSKAKVLWSRGNFISTIGFVSAETVKKYIAEQKEKDNSED